MTTIAYRDGTMAADSRAYSGDKHPIGSKVKIRRMADGTLIGASSTQPGAGETVLDWYEKGRPKDFKLPDSFTFLAAHSNGDVYYGCDSKMLSGPLTGDFFTIGSGEGYAHGAMAAGMSAEEAVRIACKADPWSGFPLHTLTHRRKTIYEFSE